MKKNYRPKISSAEKKLIRRYLVWFYKTTKEEVDRVARKDTQLMVDRFVLQRLEEEVFKIKKDGQPGFLKEIGQFKEYIANKEAAANAEQQGEKHPDYVYHVQRLQAAQEAIREFLGEKELRGIEEGYQTEMINRIWESREH